MFHHVSTRSSIRHRNDLYGVEPGQHMSAHILRRAGNGKWWGNPGLYLAGPSRSLTSGAEQVALIAGGSADGYDFAFASQRFSKPLGIWFL
jgi:hypothetical protein